MHDSENLKDKENTNESKSISEQGIIPDGPKMTSFTFKGRYGITDLKSTWPFDDWGSFNSSYPDVTKEIYEANPQAYVDRVTKDNEDYKKELEIQGKLGEEFTTILTMIHNPLFDDNSIALVPDNPKESYRLIFLNNEDGTVGN